MQNKPANTARETLTRFQAHKEKRSSMIIAQVIVSESELAQAIPDYSSSFETDDPFNFKKTLYGLGMDTALPYQRQDAIIHRNRLNQVVTCSRWVGESRQDAEWINSGYASREAIDKYSGSKILEDVYRSRSETTDTQEYLESRDKYSVIDESQWSK